MTQDDIRGAAPPKIPLIDPTANVIELVKGIVLRLDDLRTADQTLEEERIRRLDDLRELTDKCAAEIATVRLEGQQALSMAESRRVDAIALAETRRIDALLTAASAAVNLAAEKSAAQAATLATQVATSAEALRTQVAALATQTTTNTNQMREAIERRLSLLEQSQYAIGGRDAAGQQQRQGSQWGVGIAIGIASLGVGLFGIVGGAAIALLSR